jgi:hypothetical protein
MDIQSRLPVALCALHNFIQTHNPDSNNKTGVQEVNRDRVDGEDVPGPFIPADEPEVGGQTNWKQAIALRNRIAEELWVQYQQMKAEGTANESSRLVGGGGRADRGQETAQRVVVTRWWWWEGGRRPGEPNHPTSRRDSLVVVEGQMVVEGQRPHGW